MGNYASIDYELLKKQRAEGWTMDRLAQEHGVSRWTIAERLSRGAHTPTKRRNTGCCNHKPTLCWQCANAVPDKSGKRGCAWSRSFKPVKGWDADETRLYANDETRSIVSYHVRSCPEFVEG